MNYNKFLGFGLSAIIILSSVTPALAVDVSDRVSPTRQNLAVNSSTRPMLTGSRITSSTFQNNVQEKFCATVAKFSQNLSNRMSERTANIKARRADTQSKLAENRKERTERRADIKDNAQEKRLKNYDKLLEHAINDELKAAVEKFKTAVNSAIETRRLAVESANTAFRAAVDAAMAERKGLIESATAEYKTAVDSARSAAVAACAAEGADASTIRTELQTALQNAKEAYQAKKTEIEKIKVDMEPARLAHKTAIETAIKNFKAAMDAARAELKAAFLAYGEKLPNAKFNTTTGDKIPNRLNRQSTTTTATE